MKTISLIDLSIIWRRHWHASAHEEVSSAFRKTIADVHDWSSADHVAVCIDSPPYLRASLYPEYKANRERVSQTMIGQLDAVKQRLEDDGFLVVGAEGYEADDIIATFCAELTDCEITIVGGDKDTLQLVDDHTVVVSTATGAVMDRKSVVDRYGVGPHKMRDLLALVGDKSDNIPGVKGVGEKTAAKWLEKFGDIDGIIEAATAGDSALGSKCEQIVTGKQVLLQARTLVSLMTDAPIDTAAIFAERKVKPLVASAEPAPAAHEDDNLLPEVIAPARTDEQAIVRGEEAVRAAMAPGGNGNGHWETALEPRNLEQAQWLSTVLYNARLFGNYPNAEAVLGTIMTGRTFGLDAVTSLRSFHNIKGKQTMSAAMMVGLVKRSTACEYFRMVESTDRIAVYETKRRDEPEPTRLSYSLDEAKQAGLLGKGGNWADRPKTMLRWRCATELARAVYPDVVAGLYSTDEMADARG